MNGKENERKRTTVELEPDIISKLKIIVESEKLKGNKTTRDDIINSILQEDIDSKFKESLKMLNEM